MTFFRWEPSQRCPKKILIAVSILLCLAAIIIGTFGTGAWSLAEISFSLKSHHTAQTTTRNVDQQVKRMGQTYINALFQKQYKTMWLLLSPEVQAKWSGEPAFAIYWSRRFSDFLLQGYSIAQAKPLALWADPETIESYGQLEQLPISLRLTLRGNSARYPMTDQRASNLYANIPVILQRQPTSNGKTAGWWILDGGPADLEAPILPPITPVAKTVKVPIVMYHYISHVPKAGPESARNDRYRPGLSTDPTVFRQQLDYLVSQHFHTITYNQLFDALYYGGPLPSKPIILTFDDGYADAYTNAYPLLKAHRLTGMFYIIAGKVGWAGQVSWQQLVTMQMNGMQIGSHTMMHQDVGTEWLANPQASYNDLHRSQQLLEEHLHTVIQQFAYPSGDPISALEKAKMGVYSSAGPNANVTIAQAEVKGLDSQLASNGYVGAANDPAFPFMAVPLQDSRDPFDLHRLRAPGIDASVSSFVALPNT